MNMAEIPKLNVLHPEALLQLSHEYNKVLEENAEKTNTLERYRDDYKTLKSRLKTLPDKISHDALVPLGTKALAFGKIIHTNEILCLLGDNYFMECSAKTASEIVDRRLKKCEELLDERKQEAERLENWKSSVTKLVLEVGDTETMEIVEEVDDTQYEKIKVEHRENVKKYKEQLAKERQERGMEQTQQQEEFWAHLEELELEEDLEKAEEEQKKKLRQKTEKPKLKTVPSPSSLASSSSSSSSASTNIKKLTKHVQFNAIPEIKEIVNEEASYEVEERLSKSVEGISSSIVEKNVVNIIIPTSTTTNNLPSSSSSSSSNEPVPTTKQSTIQSPDEQPKKVSLFKQKRKQ